MRHHLAWLEREMDERIDAAGTLRKESAAMSGEDLEARLLELRTLLSKTPGAMGNADCAQNSSPASVVGTVHAFALLYSVAASAFYRHHFATVCGDARLAAVLDLAAHEIQASALSRWGKAPAVSR